MKNLLFITWDGPQTSYMEGLFIPIFREITRKADVKFHVIQFTWADEQKTAALKKTADRLGIHYTALPILKKPVASLGSLITLFTASQKIEKYIKDYQIDIVMPRSTFPALMVSKIKSRKFKIIFDADGLPIEERVDFAGLKKDSRHYLWMKSIETRMLIKAERVITRSSKSIDIHLKNIGDRYRHKFSVVYNGRDAEFFKSPAHLRDQARKKLDLKRGELLFVYCGSLGEQYCWEEMMAVFETWQHKAPAKFLVLTGNTEFALRKLTPAQQQAVIVKSVLFSDIPFWLSAGDVAFALRQPSYSMQGVAPIKIGEYLLMNIPTIASKGIGDTEEILKSFDNCFLYNHTADPQQQHTQIHRWIGKVMAISNINTRDEALKWFSLEAAANSYLKALNNI